jgi:hypothetical protein
MKGNVRDAAESLKQPWCIVGRQRSGSGGGTAARAAMRRRRRRHVWVAPRAAGGEARIAFSARVDALV